MDTKRVCQTCGGENVHHRFGEYGYCEDCDAPCITIEVPDEDDEERDDPRADLYAIQ